MDIALQNALALAIVLLASLALLHRAWKSFSARRPSGCGSCSSCPVNARRAASPPAPDVVAIGPLIRTIALTAEKTV